MCLPILHVHESSLVHRIIYKFVSHTLSELSGAIYFYRVKIYQVPCVSSPRNTYPIERFIHMQIYILNSSLCLCHKCISFMRCSRFSNSSYGKSLMKKTCISVCGINIHFSTSHKEEIYGQIQRAITASSYTLNHRETDCNKGDSPFPVTMSPSLRVLVFACVKI